MNRFTCLLPAAAIATCVVFPATAQQDSEAEAAVRNWVEAVMSGDRALIEAVLAPEFQIQRADGSGYARDDYIAGGFARITDIMDVTDLVATRSDELMVVRYVLAVNETVDGKTLEGRAPRLTVFRREGDRWLVVAHANFARRQ